MRKKILLGLAVIFFTACENKPDRYFSESPEIETFKSGIAAYEAQDWEKWKANLADTVKFYPNTTKALSQAEYLANTQAMVATLSSYGFDKENSFIEMVLDKEDETWVNYWSNWKGTIAANNKELTIPVHLTVQFVNGKIVEEYGYWDMSEFVATMQQIETENMLPADEKVLNANIQGITKAWNSNDKAAMASLMTDNFVRTENGNVLCKSSAEYGDKLMDLYHTSFPDFKVTLDKVQTMANNKVFLNWTCTGTNTAEFAGNPATGKKIKTHGFSVWSFNKDGKAVQEDAYYDNLTVFHQLGLTPPKS